MKYIDWLIQWLENYVRPSVKVRTYERYKLIIEQHIKDKIGGMELNDLSPLVLQSFITECRAATARRARDCPQTASTPLFRSFRVLSKRHTCWADERIHGG